MSPGNAHGRAEGGDPAQAGRPGLRRSPSSLARSHIVADGTSVTGHPAFTSVGHEFVATIKEAADEVLAAAPSLSEDVLTALRRAVDHHPDNEPTHGSSPPWPSRGVRRRP